MQDVLFVIVFFRLKEKEGQINDNLVRYLALRNIYIDNMGHSPENWTKEGAFSS